MNKIRAEYIPHESSSWLSCTLYATIGPDITEISMLVFNTHQLLYCRHRSPVAALEANETLGDHSCRP